MDERSLSLISVEAGNQPIDIAPYETVIVGRLPPSQETLAVFSTLDHPQISRRHARLARIPRTSSLLVEDLGSENGTFVSGRPAKSAWDARYY